jgi:hypothetical protein
MICQSCHMPEVERPIADGGPIRLGRRHLWRGGHDPDMIKRAVAVQVQADPPTPKPGEIVSVTLTVINAGAGHKIPTGDPDRHFTVEFAVKDEHQHVLKEQTDTMGRWLLWQPMIVELYDNRLLPLASRSYTFRYRLPPEPMRMTLETRVHYHIVTEDQHAMLKKKYQLTGNEPYRFTIYERAIPLSGDLTAAFTQDEADPRLGCKAEHQRQG